MEDANVGALIIPERLVVRPRPPKADDPFLPGAPPVTVERVGRRERSADEPALGGRMA